MSFNTIIPNVSIRGMTSTRSNSFTTAQVLRDIGNDPTALDTVSMQRLGLQDSFKQFDVTSVTPAEMGMVSKNLYALGFIDKTTANLLVSAGDSLDAYGNQTRPNMKMNALDYFAARINSLRTANINGNEYAFHVVPDYIKAAHVLQNLDNFAKQNQGQANAKASLQQQVSQIKSSATGINTWA